MIPEKGKVQYLAQCRVCQRRIVLEERILTTYGRSVKAVMSRFEPFIVADCDGCNNYAVFDLLGVSRCHPDDD